MKRYKLKNISCASCAARIETELAKNANVKFVSLNFGNSTLSIDYDNLQDIRQIIKRIEPDGEIEEFNVKQPAPLPVKNRKIRRDLLYISFVVLLYASGIIFRNELKNSYGSIPEYAVFIAAYLLSGWGVLSKAVKNIFRGRVFDETFLMTIATLGAMAIGQFPEAVAVMLFYIIGEYIQGIAVSNSRRSIKSLLEIRPDYANLKTGNEIKKVNPAEVIPGDLIIVKPGEKIPLDGIVAEGETFLDTFAITGEPVPRRGKKGDTVLSGMINRNPANAAGTGAGILTIKVTNDLSTSTISKILELVESAGSKKAETERFITTFARYYTPVIVFIALAVAFIPPLIVTGETYSDWIYRALVILVVSCPCALVVSIPLGYFGGIGGASKKGILVKGSNFLDALTQVKKVVFDKTGTLTKGVFKVDRIVTSNGFSKEEVLFYAAMAESHSNHPVAASIIDAYKAEANYNKPAGAADVTEIPGHGIKAKVNNKEIIAGNDRMLHLENITHEHCNVDGTVVHVAADKKYMGYIIISDELKEESVEAVKKLKQEGIDEVIMLTGDNEHSAKIMADKLNIDRFYSDLLPQDKVNLFEKILDDNKGKGKVAFVGDGVNDAPVIARADVGIAMGGLGSDAAVEAADVVIMEDSPSKVAEAILIARKTRRIVWQNILFAMGVKAFFIALGALGIATMWEAVFGDMGVAIIAIFNSARMLKN